MLVLNLFSAELGTVGVYHWTFKDRVVVGVKNNYNLRPCLYLRPTPAPLPHPPNKKNHARDYCQKQILHTFSVLRKKTMLDGEKKFMHAHVPREKKQS